MKLTLPMTIGALTGIALGAAESHGRCGEVLPHAVPGHTTNGAHGAKGRMRLRILRVFVLFGAIGFAGLAFADGRSWDEWLGEQIGMTTSDRAEEIVEMLVALEMEHGVVLKKKAAVTGLDAPVGDNRAASDFARKLASQIGSTAETLEVTFGGTQYLCECERGAEGDSLNVRLHDTLLKKPAVTRAVLCRMLAGRMINRNMVGQGKSDDWHRKLNEVNAVCLGLGDVLLEATCAFKTPKDDSVTFSYNSGTALPAVDIAWTMGAVALLRKAEAPVHSSANVAASIASLRGADSVKANVWWMKMMVKAGLIAAEGRTEVKRPRNLPEWENVVAAAVPPEKKESSEKKKSQVAKKMLLDDWKKVSTNGEDKAVQEVRAQLAAALKTGGYGKVTEIFSARCLEHGADLALAAADGLARPNVSAVRRDITKARWLARLNEVAEARDYLRSHEELLSGRDANFFHHSEAAQRFIILGDFRRAHEEIRRMDRQGANVIEAMEKPWRTRQEEEENKIPGLIRMQPIKCVEPVGAPPQPEYDVANWWWQFAKGKRKWVMDYCRRMAADWYEKVLRKDGKSFTGQEYEWYSLSKVRAQARPSSSAGESRVAFADEPLAAGASGVIVPVFQGAKAQPLSPLSPRTVTWRNNKGTKVREEVFYQPRDYWEHEEYVAGWMDAKGNELRVFHVRNLPLRDEDFGEAEDNCPTKEHLRDRIAGSVLDFDPKRRSCLAKWASCYSGNEVKASDLSKIGCGKLADALIVETGDLSTGGVFLCDYRKQWFFVEMRLAGEVADIGALLRSLARGSKTMAVLNNVGNAPVSQEDGVLVYAIPGYVIKADMRQGLASAFVRYTKPLLEVAQKSFRRDLSPLRDMRPSVLRVFNDRQKYNACANEVSDSVSSNRTIGMWVGSREELLVMSGMKTVKDAVGQETFRTLIHEGFHQYLCHATGRHGHATWFNEGHATYYETSVYSPSAQYLTPTDDGTLRRPRDVDKDFDDIVALMPKVIKMTQRDFYQGPLEIVNKRYAASWAIVYFLRRGIKVMDGMSKYEQVLPTYYKLTADESVSAAEASEKAWATVEGMSLEKDFRQFWEDKKARLAARKYKQR